MMPRRSILKTVIYQSETMFTRNVGTVDRVIRALVGLLLMWYGYDHQSWWGLLGLVIFATGVLGTCGLYRLLGFSTCPVKPNESEKTTSSSNPTT